MVQEQPVVIDRAEGTDLIDSEGRRYLDGVSSLWCNVHGHRHPQIDGAVRASSNASPTRRCSASRTSRPPTRRAPGRARAAGAEPRFLFRLGLDRDRGGAEDGVPVLAPASGQHARRTSFVCLRDAYHGDTLGAVSVGGIELFHGAYGPLLFGAHRVEPGDVADLERVLDLTERRWPR